MKNIILRPGIAVLALLCAAAANAVPTVYLTYSTPNPVPGQNFTVTIRADVPNTFRAVMALAFDGSKVAYVSGAALDPWNAFYKNSPVTANPTRFEVESPTVVSPNPGIYQVAVLTFNALAAGNPNVVINDDGGGASGWFDATTAEYIPLSYVWTPPDATDDGIVAVFEGIAQAIPVGNNDVGFSNPATVTVTTPPAKGTITAVSPPGPAAGMTITYTANTGATGADSFVYQIADGTGANDSATVSLTISPANAVPNPFAFTDQTGVALGTPVASNAITVGGINVPVPISVSGDASSAYSINGGAFTSAPGLVTNGNTVQVRHTSSGAPDTPVDTVLSVGGVTDTFTSTTLRYAFDDVVSTARNQPVQIDVLQNDVQLLPSVFVGIWINPLHGTAVVSPLPPASPAVIRVTYTPAPGYVGPDSFEYWVETGPVVDYAVVDITVINTDTDGDGVLDALDNCTVLPNPGQCDSDGDGYGNRCDGDHTGNGLTNAQDTVVMRQLIQDPSVPPTYSRGDLNCNGSVNAQDTVLFRQLLGSPPGPSGLVP